MKKNIYLEFGGTYDLLTRLALIKKQGFNGIFIWQDEDEKRIAEVVKNARQINLEIETMHLRFEGCNHLWLDDEQGQNYVKQIIRGVELAYMHQIPTVIMHTVAKLIHPPTAVIGLERIKTILELCQKYKINLAIENIRELSYIDYVFDNIYSPYLKMCLDFGHTNCFTYKINQVDFNKYAPYIICLHIHDNWGENDDHLLPFEGEIDFEYIAKSLKKIFYQGPLTSEAQKNLNESDELFLSKAYNALVKIETFFTKDDA